MMLDGFGQLHMRWDCSTQSKMSALVLWQGTHLDEAGDNGMVEDCGPSQGSCACERHAQARVIELPIVVHNLHSTQTTQS